MLPYLPAYVAMAVFPHPTPMPAGERLKGSATGVGLRVLVIEDDYLVGTMAENALSDAGYEVVGVAATGEEGVQLAKDLCPALVLMDIRLAGEMTGIEAAMQLNAIGIRSFFASAHTDPGTRTAGQKAQPLGWLAKPYSDSEMLAAVADAFEKLKSH